MLIDGATLTGKRRIEADVCIVGSGPAGITLANELKAKFSSIVVLEGGGESYDEKSQSLYAAEGTHDVFPDPIVSRLRFLGGTSNHWQNSTMPFTPIDFDRRDWVPGSGWPISFADVNKYYDRAGEYCGVDADGYSADAWMSRTSLASPMQGSKRVVAKAAKSARPPTRFFHKYGPLLSESNRVSVYKNSNVVDLLFDKQTKKVREIFFTADGKTLHGVSAGIFVLCMGGIENARMLLSFNEKYENALGNRGDNVGRYFMEHPTVKPATVFASASGFGRDLSVTPGNKNVGLVHEYSEDVLRQHRITNGKISFFNASNYDLSDGVSSFHILKDRLIKGTLPDEAFLHLSNLILDFDMVAEAISRKSFDQRVFSHADDLGGAGVHIMMEQTPSRHNRIRLGKSKDRFGIKKLAVDWRLSKSDIDMMWSGLLVLGQEIGALSLGRLRLLKEQSQRLFTDQMGFGLHHMGTTRMAVDEAAGVVDRDQRVFGTDNLYVAGSSVFVTGSHVAPTLTIVALSLRLAEHLQSRGAK
jgi:choline dehydrogenase-like flavoprotein